MGIEIEAPGPVGSLVPQPSLFAHASVTGPGALTALATIGAPAPGLYKIDIYTELSGTVAAADQDNLRLQVDNITVVILLLSAAITSGDVQPPFTIYVRSAGTNIRCQVIAAATGTAVYGVTIVATLVGA